MSDSFIPASGTVRVASPTDSEAGHQVAIVGYAPIKDGDGETVFTPIVQAFYSEVAYLLDDYLEDNGLECVKVSIDRPQRPTSLAR